MKSNRPVNLDLSTVLAVNMKSPVAIASILHRISGVVIFLLIPVLLYVLQESLASEQSFASVKHDVLGGFIGGGLVFVTLAGLIYHFFVGAKHLVQDFGIGIARDKQTFVFDKFYRTPESTTHFQGLGLGLYISADILERHEAEYGVDSEPGRGSTFYFTLPYRQPYNLNTATIQENDKQKI